MKMDRRELFKKIGLISGGLMVPGLGYYFYKNVSNSSIQRGLYQVGVFPLVYSNPQEGFKFSLSIQGIAGVMDPARKSKKYKNNAFVVFHDVFGVERWSSGYQISELTSNSIELPDHLGWGSITLGLLTDADYPVLPNIEVAGFGMTGTPMGRDGHHFLKIADESHGYQVTPQLKTGESLLVAFANMFDKATGAKVEIWNSKGELSHSRNIHLKAFEKIYFYSGPGKNRPENSIALTGCMEDCFRIVIKGDNNTPFMSSCWLYNENAFVQYHGYGIDANTRIEPANLTAPALRVSDLVALPSVYSGGFVFFGKHPFSGEEWKSEVLLTNLTNQVIEVAFFIYGEKGRVTTASQNTPFTIPANGLKSFDLSKIMPLSHEEQCGQLLIHTGIKVPNDSVAFWSLIKIFTRSESKALFAQHGRPKELSRFKEVQDTTTYNNEVTISDYWVSEVPFETSKNGFVIIKNFGPQSSPQSYLEIIDRSGVLKTFPVGEVPRDGYKFISYKELETTSPKAAIRLISTNEPMKITVLDQDHQGRWSARHGTERIRSIAKIVPNLKIFEERTKS